MAEADQHSDSNDETDRVRQLESWNALADAALELVREARYSIAILSTDLEPAVYDTEPLIDALRTWLTKTPRTQLTVLVRDPRAASQRGGRLLELVQRLPSHAAVRRAPPDANDPGDTFMVVDERAYLHRPDPNRALGSVARDSLRRATELRQRFDEGWTHSLPDNNLRRLFL